MSWRSLTRHDSPMLIVCPSCATSYDVNLASLSPNGRQVRCVRCRTIWHAEPSHADKLMHAAAALAPERDVPTDGAEDAVDRAADELASSRLEPFRRATDEQASTAPATAFGRDGEPAEQIERGYSDEVEAPPIVPIDLDEERPRAGRDRRVHVPDRKSPVAPRISRASRRDGCARSADHYAGRSSVCKPGFWRLRCSILSSSAGAATWCARFPRPHPSNPCSAYP